LAFEKPITELNTGPKFLHFSQKATKGLADKDILFFGVAKKILIRFSEPGFSRILLSLVGREALYEF